MLYRYIACATATAILALASPAAAGGLHASMMPASSDKLRVEVGTFGTVTPTTVSAGYCPSGPADFRREYTFVNFSPAFSAPPAVAVSLNELDAGDGRNIRVHAYAVDVTKYGAVIFVETWCNTNLYGASGSIVAVGPQ